MRVKGVVKQWRYPEASERDLARLIQGGIRDLVVLMRSKTNAMKFDASDQEIDEAQSFIEEYATEIIAAIIAALPSVAQKIYKFNSKQWLNVAKSAGGANNQAVIILIAMGASMSEPWYRELYGKWEGLTVESISKLFGNIVSDWSTNIRQANFSGKNTAQVNELANKRFAVYSSWGNNRAAGMVGAWNSRLMRQRLIDAEVTHYFWHGMLDDRERLLHIQWEGKRIALNAIHDFPGEPFGCRCWAVPDFKKIGD